MPAQTIPNPDNQLPNPQQERPFIVNQVEIEPKDKINPLIPRSSDIVFTLKSFFTVLDEMLEFDKD